MAVAVAVAVAVDSVTQSLPVVDLVRNVMLVQRELFESSLLRARSVLELLGQAPEAAQATVQVFRQHNLELFEKLHPHYKDNAKLISVVKQGRQQLEEQMAKERAEQAAGLA